MGINVRIAPSLEEERQAIEDAIEALSGKPGIQGLAGEDGVDGEDGEDLTIKPPVYKSINGANLTVSGGQGSQFRVDLDNDVTLKFSGFRDGAKFSVALTQDSTGGHTVTWPVNIKWANGGAAPTLTATANKRDTFGFERYKHGSEDSYDGFVIGQNI